MDKRKNATEGRSAPDQEQDKKAEVVRAHETADKDIAADPEFSAHSPNDDLDEGETARLGEDSTGLV